MKMKYAYAELPRTGFCNMLNPWARAFLWARDNGAKMIAPNWVKLGRLGPWLRGERHKRYYANMLTNAGYVNGFEKWCALHLRKNEVEVFMGQGRDLLDVADEHQALKAELTRIAAPAILARLESLPEAYIAVHIRRGDFKAIGRTLPESYYVTAIRLAVEKAGPLPILVFSDAAPAELDFLREVGEAYERIRIMPKAPALHDVLALSRARFLVCTNGSSFSEWSAFLGRMPTVWSTNAFPIDPRKVSEEMYLI